MGKLDGKVAIITGGGSGLGREMALELAAEGASVVVSSAVPEQDAAVAAECEALGARALAISANVTDEEQVAKLVEGCMSGFGRVDVLIAGAGIAGAADASGVLDLTTAIHEQTLDQWDRMLRINLTGVFLCAREVVPQMIRQGGGSIAGISSASVRFPALPAGGSYVVSKYGVEALAKRMAQELTQYDIRVNTIQPGGITYTPIIGNRYQQDRPDTMHDPAVMRGLASYLASDESFKITGRSLVADEFNRQRGLELCDCLRCRSRPAPLETEWFGVVAQ
jgi:NAD(P)-dependent dehydrogenase (short-subunit alcohol dehydrogenase family)